MVNAVCQSLGNSLSVIAVSVMSAWPTRSIQRLVPIICCFRHSKIGKTTKKNHTHTKKKNQTRMSVISLPPRQFISSFQFVSIDLWHSKDCFSYLCPILSFAQAFVAGKRVSCPRALVYHHASTLSRIKYAVVVRTNKRCCV